MREMWGCSRKLGKCAWKAIERTELIHRYSTTTDLKRLASDLGSCYATDRKLGRRVLDSIGVKMIAARLRNWPQLEEICEFMAWLLQCDRRRGKSLVKAFGTSLLLERLAEDFCISMSALARLVLADAALGRDLCDRIDFKSLAAGNDGSDGYAVRLAELLSTLFTSYPASGRRIWEALRPVITHLGPASPLPVCYLAYACKCIEPYDSIFRREIDAASIATQYNWQKSFDACWEIIDVLCDIDSSLAEVFLRAADIVALARIICTSATLGPVAGILWTCRRSCRGFVRKLWPHLDVETFIRKLNESEDVADSCAFINGMWEHVEFREQVWPRVELTGLAQRILGRADKFLVTKLCHQLTRTSANEARQFLKLLLEEGAVPTTACDELPSDRKMRAAYPAP